MAFQPKDDSFSLFKNDRKERDSHPDYRGDGMIGGRSVWVSAWLKTDKNGRKFMSCSVKDKNGDRRAESESSYADAEPF